MLNIRYYLKSLKVLHLLPEPDIMDTLEGFWFTSTEDNNMCNTKSGLIVLDKKDIIVVDTGSVKLKENIKELTIYSDDKNTYNTLKTVFSGKQIVRVEFIITQDIILNMLEYKSVKNTYDILSKQGYEPSSDKELIDLAAHKMIPSKGLIILEKWLGNAAFPNSKVKQYRTKVILCYNTKLIIEASCVENN